MSETEAMRTKRMLERLRQAMLDAYTNASNVAINDACRDAWFDIGERLSKLRDIVADNNSRLS